MKIIEVKDLKKYFGKIHAVDGISFDVQKGEIFGFLGPNGAGKTTTIRCIMDFVNLTSGKISIFEKDAQKDSALLKKKIGFLPGNVRLFEGWTGWDHIKFIEGVHGESEKISELIRKLDFNPKIKTRQLSSGNKQKLGLILALMNNPELLIMDEPTVGLDPLLQNTIYEILEDLKKKGTTIFMSSHNLPEVERLCSRVAIIRAGKIVALESIHDLHKKRMHHVKITFGGEFNKDAFKADGIEIEQVLSDGLILGVKGDINPLVKKIATSNLIDIEITHATLEEIFLEFYAKHEANEKEN